MYSSLVVYDEVDVLSFL